MLVFGYGSLVSRPSLATSLGREVAAHELTVAELVGYRRLWNAATDNAMPIPGYKVYVDQAGKRADVAVAFVGLAHEEGAVVSGAVLRVTQAELAALDQRERNYDSADVTAGVRLQGADEPALPVITYLPTVAAQERCVRGRRDGRLRISRAYEQLIRDGFAELGPGELARYQQTTAPPDAPFAELRRVDPF